LIPSTYSGMNTHQEIGSIFSDYQRLKDPIITEFISSIPTSLSQAVSLVLKSFSSEKTIVKNRAILKEKMKKFHSEADTLTNVINEAIDLADQKETRILLAIHQPNLFAYSGVFKKIILLQALKSRIIDRDPTQKVMSMFLIINHDFMGDFWTRVAEMPSIRSTDGILELRYPVSTRNKWKMTCNSPPPSNIILGRWEKQIFHWIKNCSILEGPEKKIYMEKSEEFWKLGKNSHSRAKSYADFSSFLMSSIVNEIWNYDTLFVNLTDLAEAFEDGFKFLISNYSYLANTLRECEKTFDQYGIRKSVSSNSYLYAPIWLHCKCGSKAPSTFVKIAEDTICSGSCMACKNEILLNFGNVSSPELTQDIISNISPRAIPILLLLSRELNTSCYVTGTGGSLQYTLVASKVFKALNINPPSVILWPSEDKYMGIGQREALSHSEYINKDEIKNYLETLHDTVEKKRSAILPLIRERDALIKKNLPIEQHLEKIFALKESQRTLRTLMKKMKKVVNAVELRPCIIDYAINYGIKDVESIWKLALQKNGDLFSPITFPISAPKK